jgi:hypothetical protein
VILDCNKNINCVPFNSLPGRKGKRSGISYSILSWPGKEEREGRREVTSSRRLEGKKN